MTTAAAQPLHQCNIEDYLEAEQRTDTKHEYLAGQIIAMGGASRSHGRIAMSLAAWLLPYARRKGCQLFSADMKVRIDHEGDSWFYYPDVVLTCDQDDNHPLYVRNPCLLVEVLSPGTEHIDSREKLLAYRLLPSLREYLMLRQDRAQADLYQRRADGPWQHWRLTNADDPLPLTCLDAHPTLRDIYVDLPDLLG